MEPGSVAFDRAAEYYDRTRSLSEEAERAAVQLLSGEVARRGVCLEVGVGTGLIALPLHRAGIPMVGIDISPLMVARLVEKAGQRAPFPLVIGDATRLPFQDRSFGGAVLRWVLHLIPRWRVAVAEMARVVRPGGVLLFSLGGYSPEWGEIQNRFAKESGRPVDPVGLPWDDWEGLDQAVTTLGGAPRPLPPILERTEEPIATLLGGIERNLYSWTWPLPNDVRLRAAAAVRAWAEERFGPLERPRPREVPIVWRAYDLP